MKLTGATRLVILVNPHPLNRWLMKAVERRLREELAILKVQINEENSRHVDLDLKESFGFLGFDFRRARARRGAFRPQYTPAAFGDRSLDTNVVAGYRCGSHTASIGSVLRARDLTSSKELTRTSSTERNATWAG